MVGHFLGGQHQAWSSLERPWSKSYQSNFFLVSRVHSRLAPPGVADTTMKLHPLWLALGSVPLVLGLWQSVPAQEAASTLIPSARVQETQQLTKTGARRTAVVRAVERVKGAVVNIHSERTVAGGDLYSLNPAQNRINGMGTGILIDHRGYIVTNHHVVEDVSLLRIRLADGVTRNAQVVARAPEVDLALLKIDVPKTLSIMPLGTSQDLMVGETVLAIGNAYGYEHTVSMGIVSAIKRDVSLNKEMSYKQLIQTDASINPGNSGGPLVNIHGELVGVNVAIRAGAQGIGFAIPVDHMVTTVTELFRQRRRGVSHEGLTTRDRLRDSGDGLVRTVMVDRIEEQGPAAQAGLRTGDELLQIGDIKIACGYDVERGWLDRRPGEPIAVLVRRADKELRLDLTLAAPDRVASRPIVSPVASPASAFHHARTDPTSHDVVAHAGTNEARTAGPCRGRGSLEKQ